LLETAAIPSCGPFASKVSKSFPPNSFEAIDKLTRNMDVQRSKALISAVAPPERIDIDDIVVRRWEAVDVTARFEAATKSCSPIGRSTEWLSEPTLKKVANTEYSIGPALWWSGRSGCTIMSGRALWKSAPVATLSMRDEGSSLARP
jgi:hypothetical protein